MSDTEVMASSAQTNGGPKRGRGRPKRDPNAPPKPKPFQSSPSVATNGSAVGEQRRGRKVKAPATPVVVKSVSAKSDGPSGAKRGRGRPPGGSGGKKKAKRGRKPGTKMAAKPAAAVTSDSADDDESAPIDDSNEDDVHEDED